MAILNNNPLVGASGNQGGYNINNSLRFRSSASAYLNRTPASAGNRQIYTRSVWVKRGALTSSFELFSAGSGNIDTVRLTSSDNLLVRVNNSDSTSNRVFRDPSAWGHLVIVVDTTQATSTNRMKAYWNNELITWSTYAVPAQNTQTEWNNNVGQSIGTSQVLTNYFDGYMAEFYNIDGQALTPSSFGETDTTTGVWKPKAYSGTYGTNGFYLKFSDIATTSGSNAGLGKDFSGNSNYWTTNNISVTAGTTYDAMTDSPTNTSATVANYCVLNPLEVSNATLSRANLTLTSGSGWGSSKATFSIPTTGKWYWETTLESNLGTQLGIFITSSTIAADPAGSASGYIYNGGNGQKFNNGTGTAYGASFTTNDVIGIAFDADAGTLTFYKNNSSQGTAFTGLTSQYSPIVATSTGGVASANFGQRPFAYTPPTGFKALNTYNLPDSTIKKGSDYFGATLYTGTTTGTGQTQTISHGQSFTPNLVWIKNRSAAHSHQLYDVIRGYGSNKNLKSNATDEEGLYGDTNGYVSAVSSSQITTVSGSNATAYGEFVNQNTRTYVGWLWAANGAGVTNTSGSITSTVSVNTTAGFSIVTYTGTGANATVGHGLGVAPKLIICKNRTDVITWLIYHSSLGATKYLEFNTSAAVTATPAWNNTEPTSSVFTVGTYTNNNGSGKAIVAYCWAEIAGFSKFGSYVGNANADGPFIYTGFRPKFVMFKRTDSTGSWEIQDTSRSDYNVISRELYANLSDAEYDDAFNNTDFLSNGFKMRSGASSTNNNPSGGTVIYMAFAENPFKNALAR